MDAHTCLCLSILHTPVSLSTVSEVKMYYGKGNFASCPRPPVKKYSYIGADVAKDQINIHQ
jgi:hypothetical protein